MDIFTARKKFAKVMFLQVHFCPQGGGLPHASVHAGIHHHHPPCQGDTPARETPPCQGDHTHHPSPPQGDTPIQAHTQGGN